MVSPQTTKLFHSYSSLSSSGGGFGGVVGDHCLQADLRQIYPSSPNSLTLYEQDHLDSARSLTSSASDSLGDIAQLEDLDCNNESLKLDIDSLCPSFAENYVRGDTVWSPTEPSLLKMEDVFRVDKNDVVQGPTLAQLNGDDSISLLDDIVTLLGSDLDPEKGFLWGAQNLQNISQQPLMQQRSCTISSPNMLQTQGPQSPPQIPMQTGIAPQHLSGVPQPQQLSPNIKQEPYQISAKFSVFAPTPPNPVSPQNLPCTQPSLTNLMPVRSRSPIQKRQSLQEYLEAPPYTPPNISSSGRPNIKPDPTATPMPVIKQEPMEYENMTSRTMDRKWEEIKQFIDEDKSRIAAAEAASAAIISPKIEPKDVAFSPSEDLESSPLKIDEDETEVETNADSDSDDETMEGDYDHAEFLLSEAESDSDEPAGQGRAGTKKPKRYFWQYNTQAKGPKGKRLCKSVTNYDPHVLACFEDPVFDPDLNQMSYKHNGKARKGDGNDITPSPLKLYQIGQELKKLTRTINDLRPVNELPVSVRSRSRKEKNKLASRACRLKKKAQHEANKLKLFGLDSEHKCLMEVINALKKNFVHTIQEGQIRKKEGPSYVELYNTHVQQYLAGKVAGHTAKYVNSVLAKVSGGDPTGGIDP